MCPRIGLDDVERRKILPLPGIEPRPSSPSLYQLSYPDSIKDRRYIGLSDITIFG
jgi:hypothetical protein